MMTNRLMMNKLTNRMKDRYFGFSGSDSAFSTGNNNPMPSKLYTVTPKKAAM